MGNYSNRHRYYVFMGKYRMADNCHRHSGIQLHRIAQHRENAQWYALANIVALFPIASLSPGYLNHFRIFTFLLLPIITITVGISYLGFNGNITPIHSIDEIIPNIHQIDVKLRVCIFLLSVFTPLVLLIYPMMNNKTYRRINNNMYLFIGFLFVF